MWIIVDYLESGETIFEGEAEVFLDNNDYDEELVEALNELDFCEVGDTVTVYVSIDEPIVITKWAKDYDEEED